MEFAKRMNQFEESIFTKLLDIKRRRLDQGEIVIDLSIGAPNIPPAKHIIEALCTAAAEEKSYVYAINDQKELLEAVSIWYKQRYGVSLNPNMEICSLLGSQEGFGHISLTSYEERIPLGEDKGGD